MKCTVIYLYSILYTTRVSLYTVLYTVIIVHYALFNVQCTIKAVFTFADGDGFVTIVYIVQ